MTEIFKAGEHIKIVRSDDGYNTELGDQTGLVGTVTVTQAANRGSVYVTFPHTGEKEFYYLSSEIARAYGTTPLPEPLKVGDWVKVVNYLPVWDGTVGKIIQLRSNRVTISSASGRLGFDLENLELTEKPAPPAPKYAVGDWVQVSGYTHPSNPWEGVKGKVAVVDDYEDRDGVGYSYVIEPHERKPYTSGGFTEKYLKPATQPITNKFKVGDWVEITGWSNSLDGEVMQVKAVATALSGYYKFENKPDNFGYSEKYLKAAEAPHWTDTKPVGAVAQLISSVSYGSKTDRVVVKIATNSWLHLYQNDDGKVGASQPRSSEDTKLLLRGYGEERFSWSNDK